jgi:hypothetical protein
MAFEKLRTIAIPVTGKYDQIVPRRLNVHSGQNNPQYGIMDDLEALVAICKQNHSKAK